MECPKCHKDTCILVTTRAKRKVRERSLLKWILWIVTFPIWGLWRILFGKKQTYHKKQEWLCQYCNNRFPQKFDE